MVMNVANPGSQLVLPSEPTYLGGSVKMLLIFRQI
jgi:hypothetical protein